jgi:hypothetical protein
MCTVLCGAPMSPSRGWNRSGRKPREVGYEDDPRTTFVVKDAGQSVSTWRARRGGLGSIYPIALDNISGYQCGNLMRLLVWHF